MPTLLYRESQNLNFAIAAPVLQSFFKSAQSKTPTTTVPKGIAKNLPSIPMNPNIENSRPDSPSPVKPKTKTQPKKEITMFDVDPELAALRKAAEGGNAEAQYDFAVFYHKRAKHDAVAMKSYHKYSGKGKSEAKHGYEQALSWYNKSASQGYAKAMCALGDIYNGSDSFD